MTGIKISEPRYLKEEILFFAYFILMSDSLLYFTLFCSALFTAFTDFMVKSLFGEVIFRFTYWVKVELKPNRPCTCGYFLPFSLEGKFENFLCLLWVGLFIYSSLLCIKLKYSSVYFAKINWKFNIEKNLIYFACCALSRVVVLTLNSLKL